MKKSLLMGLYQNYHHFFSPLGRDLKKEGLNLNEALILLALFFENEGSVTPTDLCKTLHLNKDQISPLLARLEDKYLILEKRHPKDRRKKLILLRAPGKKLATRLIKIFDQKEEAFEQAPL